MNPDPRWQRLLAHSKPTYPVDAAPPYGFITRTLAQLQAQTTREELLERIGLRAFWVSLGTFTAVAGMTFLLTWTTPSDPERSVEKLAQVDTISFS